MKQSSSDVVVTRVLDEGRLESLMASIGGFLLARSFTALVHTPRLLDYAIVTRCRRRKAAVLVQVTDLPVVFSTEGGSSQEIVAAYAFGVSAPASVFQVIASLLDPYRADPDEVKSNIAQLVVGRRFDNKVPCVACDHCGYVQEVTVSTEITRVDGGYGYGPGGSATVACSNPACGKTFEVDWDNVVAEIDIKS